MSKVDSIAIVWESITGGGVNSYLRYLLKSKSFLNKKITIFTNIENKGAKFLVKDLSDQKNIEFIFFSSFFVFKRKRSLIEKSIYYFLKPIFLIIAIFKFKKILSDKNFDVLLCQCGNYGNFRSEQAAILASKILKITLRVMVVHHECVRPPLFMGFVFKIIDYFIAKSLTSLISVSKATKETLVSNSNLLSQNSLNGHVIHNGVPINKFLRRDYLNLKIDEKILKIGMVSRLSTEKGHDDLLLAFSQLPSNYQKKMIIIIVGEDEDGQKEKLINLATKLNLENKIKFLDYVDIDSKKIILSLDLLISLTKNYEGFGLSIAEAMSVGTPILATDVGGVNEFFSNELGKLIKHGKTEDIKNSLIDFCDNKSNWVNKANLAKNKIEKQHNSEIMGANYMNHFILKSKEIK
jgi:glycosyltransferase involved in cell wall biosynthesis